MSSASCKPAMWRRDFATRRPLTPTPTNRREVGTDARLGTRDPRLFTPQLAWLRQRRRNRVARRRQRLGRTGSRISPTHHNKPRLVATTAAPPTCMVYCSATCVPRRMHSLAGGLYRDAALLFRDQLKDLLAAAEAFERAGDHDEALRLYDKLSQFERAGDLLRRLGEDVRAIDYYRRAAAVPRGAAERFLAAGDLMRQKHTCATKRTSTTTTAGGTTVRKL